MEREKIVYICETYYSKEFKKLMTMPGIKERAVTTLITEIRGDMQNSRLRRILHPGAG